MKEANANIVNVAEDLTVVIKQGLGERFDRRQTILSESNWSFSLSVILFL